MSPSFSGSRSLAALKRHNASPCPVNGSYKPVSVNRPPIRILSVDDHPLLREGVAALVAGQSDLNLVAEASNGREAIGHFRRHHPDITLMDMQMPEMNGVEATIAIREEFPCARIIVLTTYVGEETVKGHVKNILAKLGANDRTHAVTIGLRRGIIDL